MRLLNVDTFILHEFSDDALSDPKFGGYAILSHVWTGCEISHQQLEAVSLHLRDLPSENPVSADQNPKEVFEQAAAVYKIAGACAQARDRQIHFLWVDTFCIDKTSSAELTEAINSMYRWYEEATVCFTFLFGFVFDGAWSKAAQKDFTENTWFTRGWTLQELLAPDAHRVYFFDHHWRFLGTRFGLATGISIATRIDEDYLKTPCYSPTDACVAVKMSWLSRRKTSRIEDLAYCMLGLFDVNMSLLYGERDKAFQRLQRKIIKGSDDESIFAWKSGASENSWQIENGLFASSPYCFKDSGRISVYGNIESRESYRMTNKGLSMPVPVRLQRIKPGVAAAGDTVYIALNCWEYDPSELTKEEEEKSRLVVEVKVSMNGQAWSRSNPHELSCGRSLYLQTDPAAAAMTLIILQPELFF